MSAEAQMVFVIDDNISVRRSLERLLRSAGFRVECFASAQEFLGYNRRNDPSCIILDIEMPGMNGFDLQDALAAANARIPIIFLTGRGSIPQSVRAMKAGAVDFLEKPFDDERMLDTLKGALEKDRQEKAKESEINAIRKKIQSLTPRERQVFMQVIRGRLNKQIAIDLGTVEKTIKVHRAQVMRKMEAESVAALVRMAQKANLD